MEKIDAATQREIHNNLDLARSWAGRRSQSRARTSCSTIASFVKEYGITHIVMGRSRQPWYRRWFCRSLLDRLLQTISGVDVIVIDA